jgi:2-keto-4-pentenoate hydratase/2-oxohepta-3-ene-1,7-dioic acid hydratase in catechol pathway
MPQRYVRFQTPSGSAHGLIRDEKVYRISGDLLGSHSVAKAGTPLKKMKLLAPIVPTKILCVGLNYRSHIGGRREPANPEIFLKPNTSLQNPGGPIILPPTSTDVHYEGELVLVMGRKLFQADEKKARAAIWGVTCGDDVSERAWQMGENRDLQWWRAKGSDTFAPIGPEIVRGVNFDDVLLTTRLNGQVVQQARTSDLIFSCARIVSFISQFVTVEPGDIVFTGTPGSTQRMKDGDVVEVEIEGVGVLSNPVRAPKKS